VFEKDEGGVNMWGKAATLTAFGGNPGDEFGTSAGISGDTIITVEHRKAGGPSVYIFQRHPDDRNEWVGVARHNPSNTDGHAVAVSGDTAVAGFSYANRLGAAYVFERNEGGSDQWAQVGEINAPDGNDVDPDGFALRLAMEGDTMIIGEPDELPVGGEGTGLAYIFQREPGVPGFWRETQTLTALDTDGSKWCSRGSLWRVRRHQRQHARRCIAR
jgi:hypothetical protein